MTRKVYVELKVKLILQTDADDISEVIDNLDYSFKSNDDLTDIEDTEILDYEVKDSK